MGKERMLRLFQRLQLLNEQRHLYSIRTAFISTMPIMIAGAFATVINNLPISAYQRLMESLLGENWKLFGTLCFNGTTQIVTLMVVFLTCHNLSTWYRGHKGIQTHGGICGMVGLACYTIVSLPVGANSLPFPMVGVVGLFVGLVTAIACTELFILISAHSKAARILTDDPNIAVPLSFAAVKPALLVIATFGVLRVVLVYLGVEAGLSTIVSDFFARPFAQSGDTTGTAQGFNLATHLMWLFGMHGNNVLDNVAQNIFVPAMEANMAAVAAGQPPPHLVTKTLFDVFVYMGGAGTTLALLLALLLFGNRRSYRTLFRYALPTALFNINEPLIFGIPIVLNPVYAIPFVLSPVITLTTTIGAMQLGLVPYTTADISWATPVFISGYMATGSVAGSVLQLVNLALAVLIYAPFVKVSEQISQLRFERAYNDMVTIITTDYSTARQLTSRVDEVGAVARQLAGHLDNAVPGGEMYLQYQPIVDSRTNTMHSVEALLRWKHPRRGMINPMVTIALAEETGRIDKLGLWIMDQALAQRAAWRDEGAGVVTKQPGGIDSATGRPGGAGGFHVSVNVSTRQLDDPAFHQKVKALLDKHNIPPHLLQIEITETAALIENEATRNNLAGLHELGVTVAMDDFGVGHSSLLYLRTQPVSTLKIDGSLSRDIIRHPANLDIISTTHDLCKLLDVGTIVEFVDNPQQLQKLNSVGLYLVQGYYYSPPLPGGQIPLFMEEVQKRPPLA